MATIVLRGSTTSMLDDLERAIDDGVNTIKTLCRDGRMVPGAGATEINLAKKILHKNTKILYQKSFQMISKRLVIQTYIK